MPIMQLCYVMRTDFYFIISGTGQKCVNICSQIFFCSFRYHLMFSLTGGGKYNFLGTKRWIEENLDHAGECLVFAVYVEYLLCVWCDLFKPDMFPPQSPACSMTMWPLFCVWIHWPAGMNCTCMFPALLNLKLPCTLSFSAWRR